MKITKFEHACFAVEQDGQSLVVDPGEWTTDFVVADNVAAVVITHEHADHLNEDRLRAIASKNPGVVIVAHADVTSRLGEFTTRSVAPNEEVKIGNFELKFFGGQHAVIARGWSTIANLGVMINGRLYYPGDSFTVPDKPVEILALPISAPWLKFNEVVDFLNDARPKIVFPTHDAILSVAGKSLPDRMLPPIAQKIGADYWRLHEPLEL